MRRKFLPLSPRAVLTDLRQALGGHLSHADPRRYNAVQRAAYLLVMLDAVLLVISGLVLWKSVQMPVLRELLGGAPWRADAAGHLVESLSRSLVANGFNLV